MTNEASGQLVETSDISINGSGASLVALAEPHLIGSQLEEAEWAGQVTSGETSVQMR